MGYWYLAVAILSEVVATSALNAKADPNMGNVHEWDFGKNTFIHLTGELLVDSGVPTKINPGRAWIVIV